MTNFILPLLALVAGLASLFHDPKERSRQWLKHCLISALALSCGFQVYVSSANEKKSKEVIAWNREHIDSLTRVLTSFRSETNDQLENLKGILGGFGWSGQRVDRIRASISADAERTALASATPVESRRVVTVEYFPKDVDGEIVRQAIEELGFRMIESQPVVTEVETNAIWFGSEVRLEDIKLLAFTLIRAGVQIKVIRPYRQDRWRSKIQVGTDASYATWSPLSVETIREADEFTR